MSHNFSLNIVGGETYKLEGCGGLLVAFCNIVYGRYPDRFTANAEGFSFLKTDLELEGFTQKKKEKWRPIEKANLKIDTNRSIEAAIGTMVRIASLLGHCYITVESTNTSNHHVFVHGL